MKLSSHNVVMTVVALFGVALISSIAISSCNNPNGRIGNTYSDDPDVDLHLYAPYNGYGDGGGYYTQPQRVYQDNRRTTIINNNTAKERYRLRDARRKKDMSATPPRLSPLPTRLPKPKEETGIGSLPRVPMPSSPPPEPVRRRIETPSSSMFGSRSYSSTRSSSPSRSSSSTRSSSSRR